jgi:hypothetical protein
MGTQMIGRTINQQDLLCLANMALDKTDILPKLRKGEWIINGITLQGPRKVLRKLILLVIFHLLKLGNHWF